MNQCILLYFIIMSLSYNNATNTLTKAIIHSILPKNNEKDFFGNCYLHGIHSFSRNTSHSISMYIDERITFTLSVNAKYGLNCGSCVLIELVNDNDKIYLDKSLTFEYSEIYLNDDYSSSISNQFIGIVIDQIYDPYSNFFLLNTYLNVSPIQNEYMIKYNEHPCPMKSNEPNEFLFCTSNTCNSESTLLDTMSLTSLFYEYWNRYYWTILPRNFKYPIVTIEYHSYPLDYYTSSIILYINESTGFQMPTNCANEFMLICTDERNWKFRFWFQLKDILHKKYNPYYYGGIIVHHKYLE